MNYFTNMMESDEEAMKTTWPGRSQSAYMTGRRNSYGYRRRGRQASRTSVALQQVILVNSPAAFCQQPLHLAIAHRALQCQQIRRPQPIAVDLGTPIGCLRPYRLHRRLLMLQNWFLLRLALRFRLLLGFSDARLFCAHNKSTSGWNVRKSSSWNLP